MEPLTYLPDRLLSARLLLDLTQEQLGSAAQIEQSLVSMIETHQRPFTTESAETFARVMGLPVTFFTARPRSIPFDSLLFRKHKGSSNRVTQRTRVHFQEIFRVAEDLLEGTGYPTPPLPVIQDAEDVLDTDRIEKIAAMVRESLRLDGEAPVPNMTRVLERWGFVVVPIILPSSNPQPANLKPGHFGVSFWAGMGLPGLIGYFPGSSADRDRFTLAHELGHAVLHSNRTSSDPENEANRFAGAFLLPWKRARALLSEASTLSQLASIKAEWGISIQALVMRGSQGGFFSSERARSLYRQISSRGWRLNEPVEVVAESPKLFLRLLKNRFGPDPFKNPEIERETALPLMVLRSAAPSNQVSPRNDGLSDRARDVVSLESKRKSNEIRSLAER